MKKEQKEGSKNGAHIYNGERYRRIKREKENPTPMKEKKMKKK